MTLYICGLWGSNTNQEAPGKEPEKKESLLGRTFECFTEIRKLPEKTADSIRLISYTAEVAKKLFNFQSNFFNFLTENIVDTADLIDSVYVFRDWNYWLKKDYEKKIDFTDIIQATFTGVSSSCFVSLLDDIGVIEIGKIAASIGGKFPIIKPVCEMSRGTFIRGQLTVGFSLLFISTFFKETENEVQIKQNRMDRLHYAAKIGLNLLGMTIGSNIYVTALGVIAYSIGLESFIHSVLKKGELSAPKSISSTGGEK